MKPEKLCRFFDLALAESLREEARHAPAGVLCEHDGLLLCGGGTTLPLSPNASMRLDERCAPTEAIEEMERFYGDRRSSYGLHLRIGEADQELRVLASRRQPLYATDSPVMALDAPLEPASPDRGVRRVLDAKAAAQYATVVDDAYQSLGLPAGEVARTFSSPALLLSPTKAAFVRCVDGVPVAAAYVMLAAGLGLVSWVGTTRAARGRGHGEAVTRAASNAAFELGAHGAVLVASTMGEPIYRRLGYREIARSRVLYLQPRSEKPATTS